MSELRPLENAMDICLARSEDVLEPERWDELQRLRGMVRERSGFVGDVVVVALAGGTGSGKSSLFNSLCGRAVARVSIERPTTSRALAAIPGDHPADLDPLMDALGVDDVVEVDSLDRTVLLDLPDFDSTFTDHRAIVESVLSVVDAVVWVLDPEKYNDLIIHDTFLKPLAPFQDQMIFVLNQSDRLAGHTASVLDSVRLHLQADGYLSPEVVATVARATESIDLDVEDLKALIAQRFDAKRTATARLATEIAAAANDLWVALDGVEGEDVAFARASFVSLGVTAAEVRFRNTTRSE